MSKVKNIKNEAKTQEAAVRVAIETKDDALNLLKSLQGRVKSLQKSEATTCELMNEVASDLYHFLSEGYHTLLGMNIAECAEKLNLGKDSTVRFYAKHGAANMVCELLALPNIEKLEAGKKLTSSLLHPNAKGEMKAPNYNNMVECEMLHDRIKLYHELLKDNGAIKAATMACNMIKSGIETVEDAVAIAEEAGVSIEEAVNPNAKTPLEQYDTAIDNALRYLAKCEPKDILDRVGTLRAELTKVLKATS